MVQLGSFFCLPDLTLSISSLGDKSGEWSAQRSQGVIRNAPADCLAPAECAVALCGRRSASLRGNLPPWGAGVLRRGSHLRSSASCVTCHTTFPTFLPRHPLQDPVNEGGGAHVPAPSGRAVGGSSSHFLLTPPPHFRFRPRSVSQLQFASGDMNNK